MAKSQIIRGGKLNANAGIESWYMAELEKLSRAMTRECARELKKLYAKEDDQIKKVLKSENKNFLSNGYINNVTNIVFLSATSQKTLYKLGSNRDHGELRFLCQKVHEHLFYPPIPH